MICACTHENCYFVFKINGKDAPAKCLDCGNRSVRPALPEEISWFFQEHSEEAKAG